MQIQQWPIHGLKNQLWSRYSIRFKVEGASTYGAAMMIWPSSNVWGDRRLLKSVRHDIPTTKHRMTIQMAPVKPGISTGHFLVDWVKQWDPT